VDAIGAPSSKREKGSAVRAELKASVDGKREASIEKGNEA